MTDPIKAKIQELVPEVMELKFGCRIKFDRYTPTYIYLRAVRGLKYEVVNISGKDMALKLPAIGVEILGFPITLAVVLRAIDKIRPGNQGCSIDSDGCFRDENLTYMDIFWNLTKNYDDQSEETKAFIGKLLGVS